MSEWKLVLWVFFAGGVVCGAAATLLATLLATRLLYDIDIIQPLILPFAIVTAGVICLSLLTIIGIEKKV